MMNQQKNQQNQQKKQRIQKNESNRFIRKEELLNMCKACNKECTKKIQKNTIYQVDRMILLSYNLIKNSNNY